MIVDQPEIEMGWLVRFLNGALVFVTTDPLTWHPSIICRVRALHRIPKPAYLR